MHKTKKKRKNTYSQIYLPLQWSAHVGKEKKLCTCEESGDNGRNMQEKKQRKTKKNIL